MKTRILEGQGWAFEPASGKSSSPKVPTGSFAPDKQNIYFAIERRSSGKVVTLIGGLILSQVAREDLAKKLKAVCGTGGTIREGKIELQGDKRVQARQWLLKNGWRLKP